MSIASFFRASDISISWFKPLTVSVSYGTDITTNVTEYKHTVKMDGGFDSCTIGADMSDSDIDDWLENGVGRHVEVNSPNGRMWEGIVNSVQARVGTLGITRGPFLDIANRVSVTYTPYVDVTTDPPVTGTATVTTITEDAYSQGKYGILEDVVSGGTLMDDATYCGSVCTPTNDAEEIRNTYLQDMRSPKTSQQLSIGVSERTSLVIECVGYHRLFNKYVYDSSTLNTVQIPTKIQSVLAADPNSIFSSDYSGISSSAPYLLLVPAYEDQSRMAQEILQEMIDMGDANDNRTYIAVYENRKVYYSAIPTKIEYSHNIKSRDQFLVFQERVLEPWEARPAKWCRLPDFMVGRKQETSDFRLDPRNMLIESIEYSAPHDLMLNGIKVSKLPQLMKKYGS